MKNKIIDLLEKNNLLSDVKSLKIKKSKLYYKDKEEILNINFIEEFGVAKKANIKYVDNMFHSVSSYARLIDFKYSQEESDKRYSYISKELYQRYNGAVSSDQLNNDNFYSFQIYNTVSKNIQWVTKLIIYIVDINDDEVHFLIFDNEREAKSLWIKLRNEKQKEEKKLIKQQL